MRRGSVVALSAAMILCAPWAAAAEPAPKLAWSDRLVKGTSPGEPAGAKVATVASLYVLSVGALAGGVVFTLNGVSTVTDADEFARKQPANFCSDRGSDACVEYLDRRRDESSAYLIGESLFGASALLLLSGALTAEFWSNEKPPLTLGADIAPGRAVIGFSGTF